MWLTLMLSGLRSLWVPDSKARAGDSAFRRVTTRQKFTPVQATLYNLVNQKRRLVSRDIYKHRRAAVDQHRLDDDPDQGGIDRVLW